VRDKGAEVKCYLINLERSQDRLAYMASQFNRMGLEFERVEAVNGRVMPEQELASFNTFSKIWPDPLSPAEIGCFLSHRKCLEIIATGIDAYAVIFEDDIKLSSGAAQLLPSDKWIPKDADIIKIDAYGHEVLISRSVASEGPYAVARLRSRHLLTGGYVVSRDAARKLLPLMQKAPAPIDHFLFDPNDGPFDELNIYQITPAICRQAGLESTIGKNRREQKRPALFRLVIRELKRFGTRTMRNSLGLWVNFTKTGRWGPIPYDHDIR